MNSLKNALLKRGFKEQKEETCPECKGEKVFEYIPYHYEIDEEYGGPERCKKCNGMGKVGNPLYCNNCNGRGTVLGGPYRNQDIPCPACNGTKYAPRS